MAGARAMTHSQKIDQTMEQSSRHDDKKPALSENLLERVLETSNVSRAWKQVKANGGAPGIDGVCIEEFPEQTRKYWPSIRQAILDGSYQPSPVRRVEIPKKHGGKRMLGVPCVLDRLIQQAIAQVLVPIFDPEFSESSFGYRPGRRAHDAVKQIRSYIEEGYRVAVDVDVSKFFDTVSHDVLMARVARKVRDKRLLRLIGKYLRAGVVVEGTLEPTSKGVPQGGNLSPLLSNIVLDDLDKELDKREHRYARYCDDFVIVVKTKRAGERVMSSITKFLQKKLKLEVNKEKSKVASTNKCKFLGFTFKGKRIYWTEEVFQDFQHRIRRFTGRSWGVSMEYRIAKLNEYIRGWMNYYGISEYYSPVQDIDGWIRRRIRTCFWKQWRYVRTKVRELLKLGTYKRTAILTALSRKGPWHLSRTLATHTGMTNEWIDKTLGLVSVRDLWISLHYPS